LNISETSVVIDTHITESATFPTAEERKLRSLQMARPLYMLPNDPMTEEVLIPGFQIADKVDCMVGFFSSRVLESLAPGLATYIGRSTNILRLIISPLLLSEDQDAIEEGVKSASVLAQQALEDLVVTEDLLQQHTLKCLSWLIGVGRIEIKIALMKDALFHPKVWLFEESNDVIAAHGSSNVTYAGIRKNIEQVAVSKSWEDPNQRYITEKLTHQFEQLWENKDENCFVIGMPRAIQEKILKNYKSDIPPTESDLAAIYERAIRQGEGQKPSDLAPKPKINFAIPDFIRFDDGPFEHQGDAVRAWCNAGHRGILEMATGSGKTITAMICAHRLYEIHEPLLIVIAAPYIPLIQQWCDEIEVFGLRLENLTLASGSRGRSRRLNMIKRRLRIATTDIEAVIVSHDTLCNPAFHSELKKFDCATLLIADEVHNLGRDGFIAEPPDFFDFRLGLSATPVRQYDEDGTDALNAFFGPVVFRYSLEEAIGRCLVEYDYFVHPVELTSDEMDQWYEITAKIKASSWHSDNKKPDEYLAKLLRDRRAILESAENKIGVLESVLDRQDLAALRHTLIYASDKNPKQLNDVNSILKSRGILFHQLTHEETRDRSKTARIIRSFQSGNLRVLTAKRVLDEGVNIPQICKAFILASTTVERQWIQRRGRLLRTCKEIDKTHSEVHDFVALPADIDDLDGDGRALVKSELTRVQEFASLARNAGKSDGPLAVIDELVHAIYS
jgi:superfamily II DNA or RNA helicase